MSRLLTDAPHEPVELQRFRCKVGVDIYSPSSALNSAPNSPIIAVTAETGSHTGRVHEETVL